MTSTLKWDQSRFDSLVREYVTKHKSEVWPGLLNKKAFFVALAAIPETPRKQALAIVLELANPVTATRRDGSTGRVALGYVIAARRASPKWGERQYRNRNQRRSSTNEARAWRTLVAEELEKILLRRFRAIGFLRAGWVYVLKELGQRIGGSFARGRSDPGTKLFGAAKGFSQPATENKLQVTITNTAHAQSEVRGGFLRIGQPALQRAFDKEAQSMEDHMRNELKPHADKFNADNR